MIEIADASKPPCVVVTGATGFLGLPVVQRLAAAGVQVHALARTASGELPAACRFQAVDLFDNAALSRVLAECRPSHLLHLAWIATPGVYWTSPENHAWVEASLELLRAFAQSGGRRAVLVGSCAEYDWSIAGRCHETRTPLAPATLYGQCKHSLRLRFEAEAHSLGVSVAWARLFFLYGPRERPERLVASVIRSLLAGEPAACSEGWHERDFLHIDDAAQALIALLRSDVRGACNIGSGRAVSVRNVVEQLATLLSSPKLLRLGQRPTPPGEPPLLVADTTRLNAEVGWSPGRSLAVGLSETIDWWRQRLRQTKRRSA